MIVNDIMKYIESEYGVINSTPCEMCGSSYIVENWEIHIIDNIPYDICICSCPDCGHKKSFSFYAPFINDEVFKTMKKNLH